MNAIVIAMLSAGTDALAAERGSLLSPPTDVLDALLAHCQRTGEAPGQVFERALRRELVRRTEAERDAWRELAVAWEGNALSLFTRDRNAAIRKLRALGIDPATGKRSGPSASG